MVENREGRRRKGKEREEEGGRERERGVGGGGREEGGREGERVQEDRRW